MIALDQCEDVHEDIFATALTYAASAATGNKNVTVGINWDRLTDAELDYVNSWWQRCQTKLPQLNRTEYLKFLDWNARQLIPGKSGAMDDSLPPILERLGMAPAFWLKMIANFERWFHGAAGSSQKLAEQAARTGRQWLQGIGPMRGAVG